MQRAISVPELLILTRAQLYELRLQLLADLSILPNSAIDRLTILRTLQNIRYVLNRRGPRP